MTFDATFVALAALICFIGLLIFLGVPAMVAKTLDARTQAIAKELSEARRLREEAERLLAKHRAAKAAAEAEAKELIEAAKKQAELLAEETRANMSEAIARRQKQAEDRIAQAEAQAEAHVRAAAADAAIAAAEKILREQMSPDMQAKFLSDGVSELSRKFS